MDIYRTLRAVALPGIVLLAGGCAGATIGSGVGDRFLERPPYYAGAHAMPASAVGHLPIAFQRGAAQPEIFDPEDAPGSAVAGLLAEMNAYLDALDATARLAAEGGLVGTPPDVHFGCVAAPGGDCAEDSREGRRGRAQMRLAVGRPSASWTRATQALLDDAGLDAVLVITLEVGQYWPQQRNLRGDKEVQLGTGHVQAVPWLTALDAPANVLQLTGALVGRDGRAVRIGAEGLLARRTDLLRGSLGLQALISDEDVEAVRTARREELPGRPLVWEAALRSLVAELTARPELAQR